jgi:hypothetical protein
MSIKQASSAGVKTEYISYCGAWISVCAFRYKSKIAYNVQVSCEVFEIPIIINNYFKNLGVGSEISFSGKGNWKLPMCVRF